MSKTSYIGRSRGLSRLYAHLVLVTKYRNEVISSDVLPLVTAAISRAVSQVAM